jgi:hypothetical protein
MADMVREGLAEALGPLQALASPRHTKPEDDLREHEDDDMRRGATEGKKTKADSGPSTSTATMNMLRALTRHGSNARNKSVIGLLKRRLKSVWGQSGK